MAIHKLVALQNRGDVRAQSVDIIADDRVRITHIIVKRMAVKRWAEHDEVWVPNLHAPSPSPSCFYSLSAKQVQTEQAR
jgi:hypothetical protein